MKIKAHAKINLSLDIVGTDERGYHKLRMVMQSISLCDEIELIRSEEPGIDISIEDLRKGINGEIPTDRRNLMYRAAELMIKRCGIKGGVRMKLTKRIPSEAGLAGGSADAAAVLKGMNALFGLGLSEAELMDIGVGLGADIPFCITGGTALAEGIGEILTPIDNKCRLHVLLIKPKAGMSTPKAYAEYDRLNAEAIEETNAKSDSEINEGLLKDKAAGDFILQENLGKANAGNTPNTVMYNKGIKSTYPEHLDTDGLVNALINGDCTSMFKKISNVLEAPVVSNIPIVGRIKADLKELGASASAMTGSGSVVYGLFSDTALMHAAAMEFTHSDYFNEISDIIESEFM